MNKPELLSPAKNLETGIAAIQCGADAVYIGADKFGARVGAGNQIKDIEELVKFAHKYWAKVYVTINTILTDNEVLQAEKLIKKIYEVGADAVIIQDMGLLELDLPPVPLFASTQCHNNTWQKVDFLEKVGFQRVILPRELSLKQISEIKSKTNVDLEFFVHGALCVSYSGQCYLSYANGGRSGNRGECAQPCRKQWTLKDARGKVISKNKYLLSLKDLNLSEYLNDLHHAGISSFKIEGRLKDITYIKNIVSYYRHLIDNTGSEFPFNPDKTFNRGYCKYFLEGRSKNIVSFDSPKHIGEPLGDVEKVKLNNGDGITYFDKNNILMGTNDIKKIPKKTFIYRNYDHDFIKKLKNLKISRKIKISIDFYDDFIDIFDEQKNFVRYKFNNNFEIAKNKDSAEKNIKKQLSKLGETDFFVEEVKIKAEKSYFIPVSILNVIRREAVRMFEEERAKNYTLKRFEINKNNYPYPAKSLDYSANILNSFAKKFYLRHGAEVVESAAESGIKMAGKKLMTSKHCLKYQFDLCGKSKENLLLENEYGSYRLEFNCQNCEMEIFNLD